MCPAGRRPQGPLGRVGIIPPVLPYLLVAAGAVALIAAVVVIRSFGPGVRIGRLLATARPVHVAEARALAERGTLRYVAVRGRIDSEDDFEDAHHRPLVFRRTRWEAKAERRWVAFDERRESVPFQVNEGLDTIEVDVDQLDEGLIVVPRESVGVASDLPEGGPPGSPPSTPVRVRIDQISAVEHAIVAGVPRIVGSAVRIGPGLGRPLVLTTLEPAEAMRILARGRARTARVATTLLVVGLAALAIGIVWLIVATLLTPQAVAAASPTPSPVGGDPRSAGQGPGLVGNPGFAIGVVALIAVVSIAATLAYVRLTQDRSSRR